MSATTTGIRRTNLARLQVVRVNDGRLLWYIALNCIPKYLTIGDFLRFMPCWLRAAPMVELISGGNEVLTITA